MKGIRAIMRKGFSKIAFLIVGIVSVSCGIVFPDSFVHAEPAVNIQKRIVDKAIYQGVRKCYRNGMLKSQIDDLGFFEGISSLMAENANNDGAYIKLVSGGHDGLMGRMINNGTIRYNVNSDSLSCYELFVGGSRGFSGTGGTMQGILQATGNRVPDAGNSDEVVEFLENMGYEVSGESGGTCYRVTYSVAGTSRQSKNKICQRENGELFVEPPLARPTGVDVGFGINENKEICLAFATTNGQTTRCGALGDGETLNKDSLIGTIQTICNDSGRKGECTFDGYNVSMSYKISDVVSDTMEGEAVSGRYAYLPSTSIPGAPSTVPVDRAISFLSKGSMGEDLAISNAEKRILYQEYLMQYYGYKVDCATEHSNTDSIWWFDEASGTVKQCSITETGNNLEDKVHAVDDSGLFEGTIEAKDIKQYLDQNNSPTPEELKEMGATSAAALEDRAEDNCQSSGAGKKLGWILCSILELAGDTVEGMYEEHIAPRLSVKAEFFTGNNASEEQAPYRAWQQFRDIANMIFVILLLVVIFSQLTGLGIDNYGIKRILPKLIVSIVLINMSYLICMIAIDVSNIVGNGVQALFEGLGNGLTDNINIEGNNVGGNGGLVSFGLASGLAAMTGVVWASPLILLSLLPSILGALVAVFFLFFLVSARQAAIVVLVVLSPLAVACSVLPNTKSVFGKYLKMFEAILLVYPVTSVLVAGGNYVSKLLLQVGGDDNFSLALTAMVVGIMPIFFIPSMIKDSFAALGKIGGTVAGFGKTLGGATGKAVQSSDLFKNSQAAAAERSARIKGGFDRNGNPVRGRRRTIANILSGGTMGRQRNALQYQQMVAKRGSLAAADEEDFMLQTDTQNELKRITASGEINSIATMQGGLTSALRSKDPGSKARIRAYTDALSSQGDAGREAVKEAYNTAIQTGNVTDGNARTFASNIVTNHAADFKNNNRSMFEVARGINDANDDFRIDMGNGNYGRYGTTSEYLLGALGSVQQQVANSGRKQLMTSAKAETMASMDDRSLMEAFAGVADATTGRIFNTFDANGNVNVGAIDLSVLSDAEKAAVGENAYKALQNTTSMNGARVALLNKILKESGYQPTAQRVEVVGGNTGGGAGGGNAGAGGGGGTP